MKWIVLISIVVFLTTCEKYEFPKSKLSAKINGIHHDFVGQATRYRELRNSNVFGYNYHIFNLESPNISIETYGSSLVKTQFDFSTLKATFGYLDYSAGKLESYDAINGELSITKEENGTIYGGFEFTFINILDYSDTIFVTDGYFEITFREYDRVIWQD